MGVGEGYGARSASAASYPARAMISCVVRLVRVTGCFLLLLFAFGAVIGQLGVERVRDDGLANRCGQAGVHDGVRFGPGLVGRVAGCGGQDEGQGDGGAHGHGLALPVARAIVSRPAARKASCAQYPWESSASSKPMRSSRSSGAADTS